jgi:hypothetical protein
VVALLVKRKIKIEMGFRIWRIKIGFQKKHVQWEMDCLPLMIGSICSESPFPVEREIRGKGVIPVPDWSSGRSLSEFRRSTFTICPTIKTLNKTPPYNNHHHHNNRGRYNHHK